MYSLEQLESLLKGRKSARLVYRKDTKEIMGLFYQWRKENPDESVGVQSNFGIVEIGDTFQKYKHDKEAREFLGLCSLHEKMIKDYWADQAQKRGEAAKIAEKMLDALESDLKALLAKHNATLSYTIEGDTYGIYEDYQYISVTVNGFDFERRLES